MWVETVPYPMFIRLPLYNGGFVVVNLQHITQIEITEDEESDVFIGSDADNQCRLHLTMATTDRLLNAIASITLEAR